MLLWFVTPLFMTVSWLVHWWLSMLWGFIFTLVHVVWMLNSLLFISYSFRKSSARVFSFQWEMLKSLSLVQWGIGLEDESWGQLLVYWFAHRGHYTSLPQCLKEPSYAKFLMDLYIQGHKYRNHLPKKIHLSKKVGNQGWRNILPESYKVLKKKGWKGLIGHPNDRGKYSKIYFPFYFPHIVFLSIFIFVLFIFCFFVLFLTLINLLMFVSERKYCC